MKRTLTITVAALIAAAFMTLASGASGETLWSAGRAFSGVRGASSPGAEAGSIERAISSNDDAAFEAISIRSLADLYALVGQPIAGVRLTRTEPVSDPNSYNAYFQVDSKGSTSNVAFYLRHGPLTGWRVEGFDVTP